jgi:excisionase family DNA binding protein
MSERRYPLAMSVTQFAEAIGVAPNTVWNWIREGKLKSAKVGHLRLVDVQAFRERFEYGTEYGTNSKPRQKPAETL